MNIKIILYIIIILYICNLNLPGKNITGFNESIAKTILPENVKYNFSANEYRFFNYSMLEKNRLKKTISFNNDKYKNIILIWCGINKNKESKDIKFNNNSVLPDINIKINIGNIPLYFNIKKINNININQVNIIEDFKTDKINNEYILGGICVIAYNAGHQFNFDIIPVNSKLNAFSMYEHNLICEKDSIIKNIIILGSHGRKGNGSLTFINNRVYNEKLQWSSSSGQYWDVMNFHIENLKVTDKITMTTDALLQYIYLNGIVLIY